MEHRPTLGPTLSGNCGVWVVIILFGPPNHSLLMDQKGSKHRHLQSCVGTRARLGYATFMHNYGKCILSIHCTLYMYVRLCVRKHADTLYRGSLHLVLVILVRMIRNNQWPGLQAPIAVSRYYYTSIRIYTLISASQELHIPWCKYCFITASALSFPFL